MIELEFVIRADPARPKLRIICGNYRSYRALPSWTLKVFPFLYVEEAEPWSFDHTEYGFYTLADQVVLRYGDNSDKPSRRTSYISIPFLTQKHVVTLVQDADGGWHKKASWDTKTNSFGKDDRYTEEYPVYYRLKNGDMQYSMATVHRERMLYRIVGRPFKRIIHDSIDVSFSDEIGERAGSWKGGVIGCGYECLPGETMGDTLYRMMREKKFG